MLTSVIKCYHCGKKGHCKSECRSLKKDGEQNDSSYVALNADSQGGNMWIIDSGASNHMRFNQELFTNYKRLSNSREVVTASSASSLSVIGEGDVN